MANLAHLSLRLLCLFSPSPLLAARAEDWQKIGTWVHSLTEAGYAGDPKPEEFSRSGEANKDWESGRRQAMWLAQAGFSVSDDGVQLAERETRAPEERGNILVGRVVVGQPGGGFQPSRIHSLTESAFAGRGGDGGVELHQMESVFQPSRPDHQHKNNDERARESSRIKQNDFLATRYYPRQDDAQPKSGKWKLQGGKKVKYLLADAANHTYLKLPVKELLRRLQSNKHLLREQIMQRQDNKAAKLSN